MQLTTVVSTRGKQRLKLVTAAVVQAALFAALLMLGMTWVIFPAWAGELEYICSVFLLLIFIWSLWSWRWVTGSLFDPYGIFLIAAVLFNGGQALLEVFHLNEFGILMGQFSQPIIVQTLLMVDAAILSLHGGALICLLRHKRRPVRDMTLLTRSFPTVDDVRLIAWILFLLSVPAAVYQVSKNIGLVMSQGYMSLYQQPSQSGMQNLPQLMAAFLAPAAIFMLIGSKGRRLEVYLSAMIVIWHSGASLFLGTRAAALIPLTAYVWVRHRCVKPISSMKILIAGGILVLIIFPLISSTRNTAGEDRLSLEALRLAYFSLRNPAVSIFYEMGNSMNTIAYSLELIPDTRPYSYGSGYLKALRLVVPSSIWPSDSAYDSYADWLVWQVQPHFARIGGGLGYSFIAEGYANFGCLGAFLLPGLVGFLAAALHLFAEDSGRPASMAFVGSTLAVMFFLVRSESGSIVRPILYYAVVPYLLTLIAKSLRLHESERRLTPPSTRDA